MSQSVPSRVRKPPWLRIRPPGGAAYGQVKGAIADLGLHTVCTSARCPNLGECWSAGTATIMILGDTCTRACRFCAVATGNPHGALDEGEPEAVAQAVATWALRYIVLTSVDRDDLPDAGASHFAHTVAAIRRRSPSVIVECLTPDFGGVESSLRSLLTSPPDVLGHNLETVERLQHVVRDRRTSWDISLGLLARVREFAPTVLTKSSLMLGLGEGIEEVLDAMRALRGVGVDILTLGQYLQPTARHLPVIEYLSPETFDALAEEGRGMGFRFVASGPLVRSSYRAAEFFAAGLLSR